MLAVGLGRISWHPDDAAAHLGAAFHCRGVQAPNLEIQGNPADESDIRHGLTSRVSDRMGGILVAFQHHAPHSHVPSLYSHIDGAPPPLYPGVGSAVDVDI